MQQNVLRSNEMCYFPCLIYFSKEKKYGLEKRSLFP